MSEQQYRVIADRDKGDDPQWDDVQLGDYTTSVVVSGEGQDSMTRLVRIERPTAETTNNTKENTMNTTTPVKPANIPDGSVWDASQQLWVGPPSEFERGVREGVHNALAYFRDEDGHSTIDEHMADSLDRIEAQAIDETLRDKVRRG